jgi:hypothetical protein
LFSSSLPPSTARVALGFASLLGVVFFGDTLVTFLFRVISNPAIIACHGGMVRVWLSAGEDAHVRTSDIGLDGVLISLEKPLIQATNIETMSFFSNTGFEHCDCQIGEEVLLTLDLCAKYVLSERIGVYRNQVLGFDVLANVCEALHKRVEPPFVIKEGGASDHFEMIKTAYECKLALHVA